MKIIFVSKDLELFKGLSELHNNNQLPIEIISHTDEPLDIMAAICTENAALVILDDDFIQPNSARLLGSIRKVKKSLDIIFLTSNNSIEMGKKIASLVVQFYVIKPISSEELMESINSILKYKSLQIS